MFAYFYLRSLNSHGLWHPAGFKNPQPWAGAVIMALIVASAAVQTLALQRIKAGHKAPGRPGPQRRWRSAWPRSGSRSGSC